MKEIKFLNSLRTYIYFACLLFALATISFGNDYPILIVPAILIILFLVVYAMFGDKLYEYFINKGDALNKEGVPKYFRPLSEYEKAVLNKAITEARFIKKYIYILVPGFVTFVLILLYFAYSLIGSETGGQWKGTVGVFIIMFVVYLILYGGSHLNGYQYHNKLIRDLGVGVFKATGLLYKESGRHKLGDYLIVKVRGINLTLQDNKITQDLESGDLVTIEYSPNTNILWKIHK